VGISKSNVSDLLARALRILGRRDHSEAELRQKLERFGFSASVLDEVIERCYSYNYLNDERYAQVKSREMLRNGRGVGPKILFELRRRGIKENLAHAALQSASEEIPPEEVFRQQLERRFPNFNYAAANDKERRRVVGYFQRRGFDLGTIFNLLKNPDN
jgi:regulatory protein